MKLTDIPEPIRSRMELDEFVFGNSFCLKTNGKYERIDPSKVILHPETKEWEILE